MKARRRHTNATRRLGLPAFVLAGIERAERERKAAVIARPMRTMFAMLASGEVLELDGHAVMRMPECDHRYTDRTEVVFKGGVELRGFHVAATAQRVEG